MNIIKKEWYTYKEELKNSLTEALTSTTSEKETIEIMIELLKNSKLKVRRETDDV